jgi:hypothetical protein
VLDDHHAVPAVDQPVQHAHELLDVGHVQADRRLVEHVQRVRWLLAASRHVVTHLASSLINVMRCASPPDSVGEAKLSVR